MILLYQPAIIKQSLFSKNMTCSIIYSTFSNKDLARSVAKKLVVEKLIACANIIDNANSIYIWDGQIAEEPEILLFAKTTNKKVKIVIERIKQLHENICPCIVAFDIIDGDNDYMNWIENSVSDNIKVE